MGAGVCGVVLAVLLAGCAGEGSARPRRATEDLTVFAAASLTGAFGPVKAAFESAHPGTTVLFNFAGSQQLAGQIVNGAPADVFASASQAQVDVVADAGLVAGAARPFAGNRLQIAVEPGNPRGVRGLRDLARPDLKVVVAAPEVPAGQYATQAFARAGVDVRPVSQETDVSAVLSKVAIGEADAGVVYATDVLAAGVDVEGLDLPADVDVQATYPIATLRDAPNPAAAGAFVDFVLSEKGQAILRAHGFTQPA